MIANEHLNRLLGSHATVVDPAGNKIGTVGELYLDDRTQDPNWAAVKTGLFGMSQSFVPLDEATLDGDDIRVPFTKEQVKDAPRVDPDGHLEPADEDRLYEHYRLSGYGNTGTDRRGFTDTNTTAGYAGTDTGRTVGQETEGYDTSGPTTDDAMTRSEERLHVGTESQEVGRARLRKYVVTENVTRTVPVSREEVRIEREPITNANRDEALSGPELSEEEHEVILHAERPVVDKETVPVERVRLETDTVTDQETVSEEVRREEIDTDTDTDTDRRNR